MAITLQEIISRQEERKATRERWEARLKMGAKLTDVGSRKDLTKSLEKLQSEYLKACKDAEREIDVLVGAARHLGASMLQLSENRESVGAHLVSAEVEDALSFAYVDLYGEDPLYENKVDENGNTQLTIGNDPDEPEDEENEEASENDEVVQPDDGAIHGGAGGEPGSEGDSENPPSEADSPDIQPGGSDENEPTKSEVHEKTGDSAIPIASRRAGRKDRKSI